MSLEDYPAQALRHRTKHHPFAILYRKTGNCLVSFIPHIANDMLGFFLVPVIFGCSAGAAHFS